MSRQTSTNLTHPHRSRRRLRVVFVLILFLLIGAVGYWWLFLRFTVVSRQQFPIDTGILFSALNIGYPAVMGEKTELAGSEKVHWLDDCCRLRPENIGPCYFERFYVSPHRKTIARLENATAGQSKVVLTPFGAGDPRTISHQKTYSNSLRWVADDGSLCIENDRLFDAQGRPIVVTPGCRPTHFLCADSRFIALECNVFNWSTRPYRDRLLIYDRTVKHLVATPLYTWRYADGMVFHSDDRFLAVPDCGEAMVFTTDKVLARFGTAATQWQWSEDGSAWANIKKTPKILVWRKGTCRLIPFPKVPAIDPGKRGLTYVGRNSLHLVWSSFPSHIAVWGDGKLVAVSETVPSSSLRKRILMEWIQRFPRRITMNYRRMTLYQNDRRVGSHQLPLRSGAIEYQQGTATAMASPQSRGSFIQYMPVPYREHLAFTADGKHLAWLLEDNGKLQVTVFAAR